jgi:hypothetical protein
MRPPHHARDWDDVGETTVALPRVVLEPKAHRPEVWEAPEEEECAPATEREPAPVIESQVRLAGSTSLDASRFVEESVERHVQLSVGLLHLEGMRIFTYDPSTRSAWDVLRRRVSDVGLVRDALKELVALAAKEGALDFYCPDRPVAAYVGQGYAYVEVVVSALAILASELRILQPDWRQLRERLWVAQSWQGVGADFLLDEIRAELTLHGLRGGAREAIANDVGEGVRRLALALSDLQASMGERFG